MQKKHLQTWILVLTAATGARGYSHHESGLQSMGKIPWRGQMSCSGEPMSEFSVEGLASLCFPALFPYGRGDPTCKARRREVSLSEAFKHLIRYADLDTSGVIRWRFASDPRFPYWCLNIKQRHQLLGQAKMYIQQHPNDAHLTV